MTNTRSRLRRVAIEKGEPAPRFDGPRIVCSGCGHDEAAIRNPPLCDLCFLHLHECIWSGEIGADPGIEVGGTVHGSGAQEDGRG